MRNSFLISYLSVLPGEQINKLDLFLRSPYHNTRQDVLHLFQILVTNGVQSPENLPTKESIFEELYPHKAYSNLELNNTISHLMSAVRSFLAIEHFQNKTGAVNFHLLQALRDYHLDAHFERTWQKAHENHQLSPLRNATWYTAEYQLQNEWFKYRAIKERSWPANIEATTTALTKAFSLEITKWNGTTTAYTNNTGQVVSLPLAQPSIEYLESDQQEGAFYLFRQGSKILEKTSSAADFYEMRRLMEQYIQQISIEESREVYLSCINFCIRQINTGNKDFMKEAFKLYREGLERRALFDRENELPTNTYYNVHVLAHRVGEPEWAKTFLDTYQIYLPREERENFYKYNLAIYSFMLEDYKKVLDILMEVHFNEIILNLAVRTMILRAYFETREWNSLESLMASFSLFVRRHKELPAYRNHYLNLIKYTKKLLKLHTMSLAARKELLATVQKTAEIADKEWVLRKSPALTQMENLPKAEHKK
jgi:hypothetical protein